MPTSRSLGRWLRLPGRVALILGIGALSTTGTRAEVSEQSNLKSFDDILIRSEGGKIYLSEGGRETELRLTATPQRHRLLRLLEEHGRGGVKLDPDPRLIMSGGGGAGFSLRDITNSFTDKPEPVTKDAPQVTTPRNAPKQETRPGDPNTPTDKKS